MDYLRINNDVNGNPRYVFHFLNFLSRSESNSGLSIMEKYDLAVKKAKSIGGKRYSHKNFGGGIVIQSHYIGGDIARIKKIASKSYK